METCSFWEQTASTPVGPLSKHCKNGFLTPAYAYINCLFRKTGSDEIELNIVSIFYIPEI